MDRVGEVILYVEDLDSSVEFYSDVLRLALKFKEHGYAEFLTEGTKLGLFERAKLPELLGPDAGHPEAEVLFVVPDVDGWDGRLRARSVRVLKGPTDRTWGQRTVHLLDPDGHVVELAQEIPRTRPRSVNGGGEP